MPPVQQVPISYSNLCMKLEAPFDPAKILSSCRSLTFAPDFFQLINSKQVRKNIFGISSHSNFVSSDSYHQVDNVCW